MTVAFVPIPLDALGGTAELWRPHVEAIAKRDRAHPHVAVENVLDGSVRIGIMWDADAKEALGLLGFELRLRGDDRVAHVIWMAGRQRTRWQHLIPTVETYLREHLGCVAIKATARLGWAPLLKAAGYRATHLTMEKDLAA